MNDVRPVLRDDLLLDRLALGERPDDAGQVEDLLLALRADALLAVPADDAAPAAADGPAAPAPVERPRPPRVVRLRSSLAGALVAGAVVAGTCGVAAATTGNPLSGLHGVRDAVLSVAGGDTSRPPLLRSVAGAHVHQQVEQLAALVDAGRTEEAAALLADLAGRLDEVPAAEQHLLLAEIAGSTTPDLLEAAGLPDPGGARLVPAEPTGRTDPTDPGASSPARADQDDRGGDGATTAGDDEDGDGKVSRPASTTKPGSTKPGKGTPGVPGKPTDPPTTAPTSPPTTSPTTSPSRPPGSAPTTPPSSSSGYAPPPTSSTSTRPGNGRGTGSPTEPGKPSKPPKPPKSGDAEPTAVSS